VCLEKIPLGVTVHRIQLIDESSISSGDHPLYAMLISRELELDQSSLNDDGMTREERQRIKDEKEAELVRRQVEADLGGFDLEQEWVEEIERENCFEVDMEIGGAPPIYTRAYALWIVDASDNWNVIDSFQLDEFEHGLTMQVMPLTEVSRVS
jgi:cleavage and polyadenylation specificity factor subunit 1